MYARGTTSVKTCCIRGRFLSINRLRGVFRMRRWMVVVALVVLAAFLIGLRGPTWTTGQTVTRPAHQTHVTR